MSNRNRTVAAPFTVAVVGTIGQSIAHTGATGIVKERTEAMKTLGDQAKIVGNMLKAKTPFDLSAVEAASSAFTEHGEHITMLRPDTKMSRTSSKTEALPAIWSNWDDFTALATKFTEDSRIFASVVNELSTGAQITSEQSRAVRVAFFKATKSCSGCHERFRFDKV